MHRRTSKRFYRVGSSVHFGSGLRGFWAVLGGHLGHARLANRMVYWLRRSSPIWLAQNDPEIRVLMKYPG
jgi:hypothetical protein